LIEKGIIKIYPDELCNVKNIEREICIGFNIDSKTCNAPKEIFNLITNSYMRVDCDNCYLKIDSTINIIIEFETYAIKKISVRFDEMNLSGGLGFNVNGRIQWTYGYDKMYPEISHYDFANFDIGFLHIDAWLDIPTRILFDAYAYIGGNIKIGADIKWKSPGMSFTYTPKEGVKMVPPFTYPDFTSLLDSKLPINANSILQIYPEIDLHLNNIFDLNIKTKPKVTNVVKHYASENKICIYGNHQLVMDYQGKIDNKGTPMFFGPTEFYNSGERKLPDLCKQL
jgi:hypothetical protein